MENGPPLDGAVAGGAVGHAAAPQAAAKQILSVDCPP